MTIIQKEAMELFMKFRQIPPSSPYTGIDDEEARQCALILVEELIKATTGLIEPKSGLECDSTWYKELIEEIKKIES